MVLIEVTCASSASKSDEPICMYVGVTTYLHILSHSERLKNLEGTLVFNRSFKEGFLWPGVVG